MVFSVSPMPCGQNYVEPIAYSFQEFLSFVVFCKDASPLEQICWMSQEQFLELLKSEEEAENSEKDIALEILRENLNIKANSNTYRYVKELQANFDYIAIVRPDFLNNFYFLSSIF